MSRSKGTTGPCAYCKNSTPREEAVVCLNCEEITHCCCVGVSLKEFSIISKSSSYTCVSCLREVYQSTINKMQGTNVALQTEIAKLCSALTDL